MEEFPQSLRQSDSHKESEYVRDLNFLQVIAKQKMESKGKRSKMEKRWSCAIVVIGDDPLV